MMITLLLACLVAFGNTAVYHPTSKAPFAWDYSGPLGPSKWWPLGFTECDVVAFPHQSPIFINTTEVVTSVPARSFVVQAATRPAQTISFIMHLPSANNFRAELWPAEFIVDILENGELPSNSTKYVLHHLVAQFPAQHPVDGVRAEGELSFVFFPIDAARPYAEYAVGGINFVIPFTSSATAPISRFDRTLSSLIDVTTTYVGDMHFSLPTFGPSIVYDGSLSFPPCTPQLTTVVSTSVLVVNAATVAGMKSFPPPPTARDVISVGTRQVTRATVTWQNLFWSPPTEAEIAARPIPYIIQAPPIDVTVAAYGYGALSVGMVTLLLFVCLLVQWYDRWTFVHPFRDTWTNPVSEGSTFGCAPETADEDDEEGDLEEGEDEEGGDYQEDDDED